MLMALTLHIRDIRKERGLTLSQLAEMVGVSIPHMSEVERGKKNVNNHLLTRLAGALNVPPEALIGSGVASDVMRLAAAIEALGPADRARVAEFVRALSISQDTPHKG